jgi:hypothetical protein
MQLIRRAFGTKRAVAISTGVIALLIFASVGLAAWLIYSNLNGSVSGKFDSPTSGGSAILLSDGVVGSGGYVAPGGSGDLNADVYNNDPNYAHTIASVSIAGSGIETTPDASCASFLSFNAAPFVGVTVPAGGVLTNHQFAGAISASLATPLSCAGQSIKVFVAGTTTP